jgi:hypothetical protein
MREKDKIVEFSDLVMKKVICDGIAERIREYDEREGVISEVQQRRSAMEILKSLSPEDSREIALMTMPSWLRANFMNSDVNKNEN